MSAIIRKVPRNDRIFEIFKFLNCSTKTKTPLPPGENDSMKVGEIFRVFEVLHEPKSIKLARFKRSPSLKLYLNKSA